MVDFVEWDYFFAGTSFMPHFGHLPGLSDLTSGCIEQVQDLTFLVSLPEACLSDPAAHPLPPQAVAMGAEIRAMPKMARLSVVISVVFILSCGFLVSFFLDRKCSDEIFLFGLGVWDVPCGARQNMEWKLLVSDWIMCVVLGWILDLGV